MILNFIALLIYKLYSYTEYLFQICSKSSKCCLISSFSFIPTDIARAFEILRAGTRESTNEAILLLTRRVLSASDATGANKLSVNDITWAPFSLA